MPRPGIREISSVLGLERKYRPQAHSLLTSLNIIDNCVSYGPFSLHHISHKSIYIEIKSKYSKNV